MIFAPIRQTVHRTVHYLETADIPFSHFVLTFFAAATLRNFLEQFVFADSTTERLGMDLTHYYLSYVCLALAFIILLRISTKGSVERVSRVVLPSFIILNIVPILDLFFLAKGQRYSLGYMFPGQHDPLWQRFFSFFGPLGDSGITYGMRTEIALVLLGCGFYFSLKGLGWGKNLLFCLLTYTVIFAYCALPYIITFFLGIFHIQSIFNTKLFTHFYLLLIFLLTGWVAFLCRPGYWGAIIKDVRPLRLLHFEMMFLIGIFLAARFTQNQKLWDQQYFFEIIFTVIAIAMAWIFSVTTNNLADLRIDAVSSSQRPTVSGAIPLPHYRLVPWFFFLGAIIYSWVVNFSAFFIIVVFMSVYFLYSMPPFRLKRIPVFSKFFIVFNSILLLGLGFLLQGGENLQLSIPSTFSPAMFFFI